MSDPTKPTRNQLATFLKDHESIRLFERLFEVAGKLTPAALTAHIENETDAHDASAISNIPAGTIEAINVQTAINELDEDITAHKEDTEDAHDASAISNVPAGNISSTDVQSAINELNTQIGSAVRYSGLVEHEGGIVTINGGDSTKIDITACTYWLSGIFYTYAGGTALTPTIGAGDSSFFAGLDATGLIYDGSAWSDAEKETVIPLCRLQTVQGQSGPGSDLQSPIDQRYIIGEEGYHKRLWHENAIGVLYAEGGEIVNSATAFQVSQNAGVMYNGQATRISITQSDNLEASVLKHVGGSWILGTRATIVTPKFWDDGTDEVALGNNKWAAHTLLKSPKEDDLFILVMSPAEYASQAAAEAADVYYGFFGGPASGVIAIANLIIKGAGTDVILDDHRPRISAAPGNILGTATMQQIYDNSSTPEILTDTTRGALSIKRGTAADTDDILEVLNNAGIQTFAIDGNGALTATAADINLPGDDSIIIDGQTNARTITVGAMRQLHRAGVENTRAYNIEVDANGYSDTSGIVVNFIATNFAGTDTGRALRLNVDTNAATGGRVESVNVSKSGAGTVDVHALHVGSDVAPVHQISGAATAIEKAFTYDDSTTTFADVTAAFNATGTNVTIFEEVDDYVYIGHSTKFAEVDFQLGTISSKTIAPTFEFSIGGSSWTAYTPADNTNGMTVSGVLNNEVSSMTGWAIDTVNGVGSKYWIRIKRTRNVIATPPIESKVTVTAGTEYIWDENGNLEINDITPAVSLDTTATTFATAINEIHGEIDAKAPIASPSFTGTAENVNMPTVGGDAIVEQGSNSNGKYTIYADGTLICTHEFTHVASGGGSVQVTAAKTFPYAFISAPIVTPSVYQKTGSAEAPLFVMYNYLNTPTTTTYRFSFGTRQATAIVNGNHYFGMTAIGRWK